MNAFTVDLEDWYCSHALEREVPFEQWSRCASRVGIGTRWLLDLLERHRIEATFFVLGYVAEREPVLVREIAERGHEIASHGYRHDPLSRLDADLFALDLEQASRAIELATGQRPTGYRAPGFSVTRATARWVYRTLRTCGFRYSSSVLPTRVQPGRGIAGAPLIPYHPTNDVLEVPISCAEFGRLRIPAAGGGYLRQLPVTLSRTLWRRCNAQGRPVIFHIHPWELDAEPLPVALPLFRRVRQQRNIVAMHGRVEQLVQEFAFTSIRNLPDVRLHLATSSTCEQTTVAEAVLGW